MSSRTGIQHVTGAAFRHNMWPQLWKMLSALTAWDPQSRGTTWGGQHERETSRDTSVPSHAHKRTTPCISFPLHRPRMAPNLFLPTAPSPVRGERWWHCCPGRSQHEGKVAVPVHRSCPPAPLPPSGSSGALGLLWSVESQSSSPEIGPRWWVQVRGAACLPVL